MQVKFLILLSMLSLSGYTINAQSSARDVLEKSINYHDPEGLLTSKKMILDLIEKRPNGSDRKSQVILHPSKEYYKVTRRVDADETVMELNKGMARFQLNGTENISKPDLEKHRLNADRLTSMKNYYRYLWLLPVTLLDNGTIIHDQYETVDFFGKHSLEIKVTYTSDVGKDIWYFYFNPESFALEGYRFYHDQAANDGEYILLSGTAIYKSIRIPKVRKWYTHKDNKYLGADELDRLMLK